MQGSGKDQANRGLRSLVVSVVRGGINKRSGSLMRGDPCDVRPGLNTRWIVVAVMEECRISSLVCCWVGAAGGRDSLKWEGVKSVVSS